MCCLDSVRRFYALPIVLLTVPIPRDLLVVHDLDAKIAKVDLMNLEHNVVALVLLLVLVLVGLVLVLVLVLVGLVLVVLVLAAVVVLGVVPVVAASGAVVLNVIRVLLSSDLSYI